MPISADNEEFLTIAEACEYLGISRQALRLRAREHGIHAYKQGITRRVYYKKSDLDRLKAFRPVDYDEEVEEDE
jgi:excisionase family DNA binding protein